MGDLVILENNDLVTTTLAIAEGTKSEHASVIKLVRHYVGDLEMFGRVGFEIQPFETAGGEQRREYALLNERQATLLMSYMRNTEIVRNFKKQLVTTFYKMAGELQKQAKQVEVPQTLPEALRLAADLAEKNTRLAQEAEKAKPKVAFHDAVKSCPDTMEVGRFAKIIGTGRNRLFAWLRDNKYLMANNLPYQPYVDQGLFRVIERPITINGEDKLRSTTLITGKGQAAIHKKWSKAA